MTADNNGMTEILAAVDGSDHSTRVIEFAVNLAKAMSASIVLVYSAQKEHVPVGYKEYAEAEGAPEDYHEELASQVLADYAQKIAKKGVKVESISGVRDATKLIIDTAKAREVSQIVIGVHGLHRLAKVEALGSVARRVVESSPVPVTVVP